MRRDLPARIRICAAALAALSSFGVSSVGADANGVPLCTAANDQLRPVIVSDGSGGAIVAWHDNRPTAAAGGVCYAQHVNANGAPQWAPDGVALSTTGDPGLPVITSDGAGGAFVAFAGDGSPPRAQWVNAAGVPQWGADGAQLSVTTSTRDLAITRDLNGGGGAIVAWRQDGATGGTSDIFAQRVNSAGAIQWGGGGDDVTPTNMNNETLPALVSDGSGGVFIVWLVGTVGARVQRLNSSGTAQWSGTPLSATSNNNVPVIVADGTGGAIAAWAGGGTYAQRVSSAGVREWSPPGGGVTLSTTGTMPTMISDGAGGATIVWQDFRSGTNYNLYAQRVNSTGATQWTVNGAPVCTATADQLAPTIVSDGGTGSIISWYDLRYSNATGSDIYVQRLDSSGAPQWMLDGLPLCTVTNNQDYPTIASDGAGGAFVAWQDLRSGTNEDIYAQRVTTDGMVLSVPPTRVTTAMGRAWPNPFSDGVRMEFVLPAEARIRMKVCDVGGRIVRDFGSALLTGGSHSFRWDGRASDGRQVREGIYFLDVKGPGIAFSRSVVRLK